MARVRSLRETDTDAADWYAALPDAGRPAGPAGRSLLSYARAGQLVAVLLTLVVVVVIGEAVAASVTAVPRIASESQ